MLADLYLLSLKNYLIVIKFIAIVNYFFLFLSKLESLMYHTITYSEKYELGIYKSTGTPTLFRMLK